MDRWAWAVPVGLTVAAAVIDARRGEIPDQLPIAICVWGLVVAVGGWRHDPWWSGVAGLVVGAAAGALLFFAAGFGGGDAKLVASLGLVLGTTGIVWTLLYTGMAGGLLGVVAAARGRRTFAYGPAVAIGLCAYLASAWKWL